jgi:hypothetical protein
MPSRTVWSAPVPNSSKIAERLRAHARLCRQVAEVSWSEEIAMRLGRIADECSRAAEDAEPQGESTHRPTH